MRIYKMITDEECSKFWGNAKFGGKPDDKVSIVMNTVLKRNAGWHSGFTAKTIAEQMKLINSEGKATARGRFCLYEYFHTDSV